MIRVVVLLLGCLGAGAAGFAETQVWLDVDVAAGIPQRDVDDALAMIQAFHSPSLVVRGVSAVYGNAPLKDGLPIAREVAEKFGPEGLTVHAGAAGPEDLGKATDAVEAMASALRAGPMVILALGPLTNVGSLLRLHADLEERIESIVIVAARRPGQRFTYPEANGRSFGDFNFENDPEAMQVILDTEITLVFAPWEVSSHVWITQEDLDWLEARGGSGAWIAEKTGSWIALWKSAFGQEGFNPFDTLAVAWTTHPELIETMKVRAWIEELPDDTAANDAEGIRNKPYLLVHEDPGSTRSVTYAYRPKPELKAMLLGRLAGGGGR